MKNLLLILLAIVLVNCAPKEESQKEPVVTETPVESKEAKGLPEVLQKALDAHGGLDVWNKYATMEYRISSSLGNEKVETQLFNLKNRKVRISGDGYTVGMDGEQVWVSPKKEAFGSSSARFYHNLYFYFFSIPFVLADDGINYEDLGTVELAEKEYRALKVSYNEGVGDADDDFYIAHFNPKTFQLELLLYTVTYYSGEKHENYNALKYDNWQEVNGLLVPVSLDGYKYADGMIGELRYQAKFDQIVFKEEAPDESLFTMPAEAEIDSLKVN